METRVFGRTGWRIGEIGYGMWGMAGWTGGDDKESERAMDLAFELGCNFFDTAWAYGQGRSEGLLGAFLKRHSRGKAYVATKIPPKNSIWPSRRDFKLEDCFPEEYILEYTDKSLKNLGVETIDLQQFHVWEDSWAADGRWQEAVDRLKREGKIKAVGISVNRWEPDNCLETLKTGLIDSVQVIYNIFDQAPQDALFPLCEKLNLGVIARVPFDEGALTGKLTRATTFPREDWRSTYFGPENLNASVDRAEKLQPLVPAGMSLPELALRFIHADKRVSTTIPGMRRQEHVRNNLSCSDGRSLPVSLLRELKRHRWDRKPSSLSH
jgi:aryl-alcohol dehydrogenase-like predicted oxidoreductase